MDVVGRSGEAGNGGEWKKGVEGQLQVSLDLSSSSTKRVRGSSLPLEL